MTSFSPSVAEPSRWFARRGPVALVHKETVTAGGGSFQALFQRCQDGGYVVSLPAVPQLMNRGATYQHARIKAVALLHGYLRELRAQGRLASRRRPQLPLEELRLAA